MSYRFRPGASPVVAALFASGAISKNDRVLDVGCGTGTDSIAFACWGLRHVRGIDVDSQVLETAVRRARAFGIDGDEIFHAGSITATHACFGDREFSVVIDSLVLNNLSAHALPFYAAEVARILEPGGTLVLQLRQTRHFAEVTQSKHWLPGSFRKWFKLSDVVTTHLAENPSAKGRKGHAIIGISIGTRRRARVK